MSALPKVAAGLVVLALGARGNAQAPGPGSAPGPVIPAPGLLPAPKVPEVIPSPRPLKADVEALARERQALKEARDDPESPAAERIKLRLQLLELVKKLADRRLPGPAPETGTRPPAPRPRPDLEDAQRPVDAVRAAANLYRSNDFDAALRAFRLIDLSTLGREDRAFSQYMTACCLRRLGKLSDAAVLYREVAEAHDDDFVTECAVWQLSTIRWTQELEAQLEDLRARRKSR